MSIQTVFKRRELKYILTLKQKEKILQAMVSYMKPDQYGRTTIRNIYFDTDDYVLIRRSIEKPVYKEKLRVRSYGKANEDSFVFVELKKKYEHVVYKRRITLLEKEAMDWLNARQKGSEHTQKEKKYGDGRYVQISDEIDYFIESYKTLHPTAFLSYEREAYYAVDGSDFRVTFDEHVLFRESDLSLGAEVHGISLLPEGMVLMELKCSGGIPLWMTQILSAEKIYKTSFSKYGTGYQKVIFPRLQKLNQTQMVYIESINLKQGENNHDREFI